jgi:hypothetical protein
MLADFADQRRLRREVEKKRRARDVRGGANIADAHGGIGAFRKERHCHLIDPRARPLALFFKAHPAGRLFFINVTPM